MGFEDNVRVEVRYQYRTMEITMIKGLRPKKADCAAPRKHVEFSWLKRRRDAIGKLKES